MKKISPHEIMEASKGVHSTGITVYANSTEELDQCLLEAEKLCSSDIGKAAIQELLKPISRMRVVFDSSTEPFSFGFFSSRGFQGYTQMPFRTKMLAVAANSFHVKPLIKWVHNERPFALLYLENNQATVYEGTTISLNRIETMTLDTNFPLESEFRRIDQRIYAHLSIGRHPLVIAGDLALTELFKEITQYKKVVDKTIEVDEAPMNKNKLHLIAQQCLEPFLKTMEFQMINSYWAAKLQSRTSSNLNEIIKHALAGEVRNLFVNERMQVWGQIDQRTGEFSYHPRQLDSADDDVLDDVSEIVLRHGGTVTVLTGDKMPDSQAAAAILRPPNRWKKTKHLYKDQMQQPQM